MASRRHVEANTVVKVVSYIKDITFVLSSLKAVEMSSHEASHR
jgi:hypothetical protein